MLLCSSFNPFTKKRWIFDIIDINKNELFENILELMSTVIKVVTFEYMQYVVIQIHTGHSVRIEWDCSVE